MAVPVVTSPCINICRMDDISGLCVGCQRTLDEIAGWSRSDDQQRREILRRIKQRRGFPGPAAHPGPTGTEA